MDALTLTEKLREADFDDRQADLQRAVAQIEAKMQQIIAENKADLMKFFILALAAFAAIIVTVVKWL